MSSHCNRLYLFLDGELSAVDEENFRHHLARCAQCAHGLHEAMQLELLCLHTLRDAPVVAPVALVREWAPHSRRPRGRWPVVVALALAAALMVLVACVPASREMWLAHASTRLLEARVAYGRADRGDSATSSGPSLLPRRELADLEDPGDLHGIAAAYLGRKDPRQASEFLRRVTPSPDLDCNQALIALEAGHHEEALARLESVLSRVPQHPQALWNRALVLRELKRALLAAEALEAVASQGLRGDCHGSLDSEPGFLLFRVPASGEEARNFFEPRSQEKGLGAYLK